MSTFFLYFWQSPKDFDFELPRWPTYTAHSEIQVSTESPQHTLHQETFPKTSSSPSTSPSNKTYIQPKGRRVSTSPAPSHQTSGSTSRPCKQQPTPRKSASMYTLQNPTSATKETHYITIEPPTCSPFDTRSLPHSKTESEEKVNKTASYRVTLKDKEVVNLKEKSSVDMVADANRPLAVCEVVSFENWNWGLCEPAKHHPRPH